MKKELQKKGYNFFSSGDTEVVLKSFIEWGKDCFTKFNGMFSFCIFNKQDRILTLARDRFGEKPIYYSNIDNQIYFSSDLRSLTNLFDKKLILDQFSIESLLKTNFIPNPHSIYTCLLYTSDAADE